MDAILERRAADPDRYQTANRDEVPPAVLRWNEAVHDPVWYDLEVDTSKLSADECATAVLNEAARNGDPRSLDRHRSN